MAPGYLMVLLEVHCFPDLDQCVHLEHDLNHSKLFTKELLARGLIEPDPREPPLGSMKESGFCSTTKGCVYINAMGALPMPTQSWEVKL